MSNFASTKETKEEVDTVEDRRHSIIVPDNESQELSIWATVKANPKAILASVAMTVGPLLYGYDNIIVGLVVAMPSFQARFGSVLGDDYIIPALWLSLWNALLQVGAMLGAVANGPTADRFGRKVSFTIGAIVAIVATAVIYTSDHSDSLETRRGVFLGGKIILGFGLGMLMSSCQTYISEVVPPRIRGPCLACFTFFLVVGQLIAISIVFAKIAIVDPSSYRICFASQWSFAGAAVVVGIVVPESPVYLVKRGKIEQAEKAYAWLHSRAQAPAAIKAIKNTVEAEELTNSVQTSYLDCFKKTDWRRTRISIYGAIVQQFLGVTLLSNSTYFLELGGLSPTESLSVTEISIGLALVANVVSWFTMTKFGRRSALLFSCGLIFLLWLGVGIAGCFPSSSTALWAVGILLVLVLFVYGTGAGGIGPVISAEVSSVRLRAKTLGVSFLVQAFASWLFNFVVPYMFSADEGNLGGKTGFIFAGLTAIAIVVLFFEVPELKNRTYVELDEMFEKRLPTRQFSKYTTMEQASV